MKSTWLWGVILLIILIGGYWYFQSRGSDESATMDTLGTYAYTCENGSQFTMSPSADVSSVKLSAGSQGILTGDVTLSQVAGTRYEGSANGSAITFVGAGEEVRLTVGSETTVCNPVPNPDSPPWNWGDPGEGGGIKQDAALIVGESIVGKWQSTDDAKFVREFKAGNVVEDWYDGKKVSSGLWVAFEKGVDAPEVPFPLEDNVVYIQMTMTGSQADTLNFKLSKLTPEELQLIYMDRGGALSFRAVQ